MARTRYDEPEEDDSDDWDESDEDDYDAERDYDPDDRETYPQGLYHDDGPETVPCPHCKAEVFEDAEQCPRCGNYLSREDAPSSRGGTWVVVMILALLTAIMLAVAG